MPAPNFRPDALLDVLAGRVEAQTPTVDGVISRENALAALALFWRNAGLDPDAAFYAYTHATVSISSTNGVSVAPYLEMLTQLGVTTAAEGDLDVVITNSYLEPHLQLLNSQHLAARKPWLLVNPFGRQLWIGPLFYPGETGCWACLQARLLLHKSTGHQSPPPRDILNEPPTTHRAQPLLAVEILKWFGAQSSHPLAGVVHTIDVITGKTQRHLLTRRPQCPVCDEQHLYAGKKEPGLSLHHQKASIRANSGYRTVDALTTFHKYRHHVSPITGIVSQISLKHVPGGSLPDQARTVALCEALERYSGIFQGNEQGILASLDEMGHDAISPAKCMLFSAEQYKNREAWHRACDHPFQHVPAPFDASARIEWSPLWSLTLQRVRYLPAAYCYFDYKGPHPAFCRADSNGNAAGNTLEEAILHGIFEVVERDCVSMWWYNELLRPEVDINTFNNAQFDALQHFYHSINRELWVLDVSADMNIPAFAAVSRKLDHPSEEIIFGFGAHLHAETAILRALTEMTQLLLHVNNTLKEETAGHFDKDELELKWWRMAKTINNKYLLPDPQTTPRTARDFDNISVSGDLLTDIERCVSNAGNLGLEILVLDQTRPDVALPVVKVIIPGMRIFWKRLAPGRLYDVPVKMGWLDAPRTELEMNPFPFFL